MINEGTFRRRNIWKGLVWNEWKSVAIKVLREKIGQQETKILSRLRHPNIIGLIDANNITPCAKKNGTMSRKCCIFFELAKQGNLFEAAKAVAPFQPEIARFYFKQLLSGLIYMKKEGICHRDINLRNILLDEDFNLKIGDFGLSALLGQLFEGLVGTLGFMAPEIENHEKYDGTQADVQAAGVTLFYMFMYKSRFSKAIYQEYFCFGKIQRFWQLHQRDTLQPRVNITDEFKNLIEGMLNPNPNQRLTLEECLQHPWTQGVVASQIEVINFMNPQKQQCYIRQQYPKSNY